MFSLVLVVSFDFRGGLKSRRMGGGGVHHGEGSRDGNRAREEQKVRERGTGRVMREG